MFRFKRPFFHFGSGCLLTDEAARLRHNLERVRNACCWSSIMGEVLRVTPLLKCMSMDS